MSAAHTSPAAKAAPLRHKVSSVQFHDVAVSKLEYNIIPLNFYDAKKMLCMNYFSLLN